ncbi:MAG: RNA polymerase sigma factor [Planctomycetales bacterium]|nr:RNA polymerase sigma factor [Planctomycetales bacterium]
MTIHDSKNDEHTSLPLSVWTDEQLVERYRETGEPAVFSEIVRRYERELYSYLRRYLGQAEMAEDAFQWTFLQLHLKCDQFDPTRKLRPWLYMIATNKAIDLQRRNRRHRMISLNGPGGNFGEETGKLIDVVLSSEDAPSSRLDDAEKSTWLRNALGNLPEHLQLVVNLVYFQGLKYREAADVLAVPVGTVKSRLHAAITKLTDQWDQQHSENE